MFKLLIAFLGIAALALAGAVFLLIWIAGQTPIHVTEESEPAGAPHAPEALVNQGAVLAVLGEVSAVHDAEWTTSDGTRPGTPWAVSGVPEDDWIQTPFTVSLDGEPILLQGAVFDNLAAGDRAGEVVVALRGGEIGGDRYEINDGRDRDFAAGDRVLLVLSAANGGNEDSELLPTDHGPGWELMQRYSVTDGSATLIWGDESFEWPLDERIDAYRAASR